MLFQTTFFVLSLSALVFSAPADTEDPQAVNLCKTFHPDHVDDHLTAFMNSKCSINCYIRGYPWTHLLHENEACPDNEKGTCQAGVCVVNAPVDPNKRKLGHIDIEMMSASTSVSGHLYATACIQNNTKSITFPMTDRSQCAVCTTKPPKTAEKTFFEEWNTVCTGSAKALWNEESRVTFEVFSTVDEGHHDYMGTATLTIPQILSNHDNNKKVHLALTGAKVAAQMNARITWTPMN